MKSTTECTSCGHHRAYHEPPRCVFPTMAGAPCSCAGFAQTPRPRKLSFDMSRHLDDHHARLLSDLASRNITSLGVGAIDLDVEMARAHGWSDAQIVTVFEGAGALVRQAHRDVAFANGRRYVCPICECWTDAPPKPCHLCKADDDRVTP